MTHVEVILALHEHLLPLVMVSRFQSKLAAEPFPEPLALPHLLQLLLQAPALPLQLRYARPHLLVVVHVDLVLVVVAAASLLILADLSLDHPAVVAVLGEPYVAVGPAGAVHVV